jgi:hypothetical protein
MHDEPEQEALFEIEGLDERECVWIHSTDPAQSLDAEPRPSREGRGGALAMARVD